MQIAVIAVTLTLAMSPDRAAAQGPAVPQEKAPMPAPVPRNRGVGAGEAWYRREHTFVSRGLNINKDWGTFQLLSGGSGKALYVLDKTAVSGNLEFLGVYPSSDVPWVSYRVYKEAASTRLWAFQVDWPSINGYVIYTKAKGAPGDGTGWQFYDFAHKYPERQVPQIWGGADWIVIDGHSYVGAKPLRATGLRYADPAIAA
jgi:hypothetical protein